MRRPSGHDEVAAAFRTHSGKAVATLVRHFGDKEDPGTKCGHCDFCKPVRVVSTRPVATARTVQRVERRRRAVQEVDAPSSLVEALREFRREEARARSVPAFRILTDRVLFAIAQERPTSEAELLRVHGVSPSLTKKYGRELLRIMRSG